MAYCDQQGLADRFGEAELLSVADRDDDGIIDADIVAGALTDAQDEIDAYLATRYETPVPDPVPGLLVRLCADIARYRLYDDNPLDEVRERYDRAVTALRDIANGKARLPVSTPTATFDVVAERGELDRTFTRETLVDF